MIEAKLKATDVAEYFIEIASSEEKNDLTPKKLQKILYYSQAWFSVFENDTLFDDRIEAWLHGPAILSIYHNFKQYGFFQIDQEADQEVIKKIPESIKKFLNQIWAIYGKYDADYLEILSHNEMPWQNARKGVGQFSSSSNEISVDDMRSFYKNLLEEKSNGK